MNIAAVYEQLLGDRFQIINAQEDLFVCARCMGGCETKLVYFSLHNAAFGDLCAGSGEVRRLMVPFCRHCGDTEPDMRGCIHVRDGLAEEVVEVNLGERPAA